MKVRSPEPRAVDAAREIADAVLFEGYMLYPYRANDPKNKVRWQFGVLAPPSFAAVDGSERAFLQTDCLLEGHDVTLSVQVRFLHVQRRSVERLTADGFAAVGSLDVGDATYLPWDEAVLFESTSTFNLAALDASVGAVEISVPGDSEVELLRTSDGAIVGRLVRDRLPLVGRLAVDVEPLPGPYGVRRVRVRLENHTSWASAGGGAADRPDALRHALVAAHLVVATTGGAFVSLIDPPEWAKGFADSCQQVGSFPVLAGPPGDRSLVLASPIILYDHPQVAPESTVQFCDATEMDEMLMLRTLTLTNEEKRQARGSDARAAALIEQVDNLPGELMERLHGAIRSMTSVARPTTPEGVMPWWDPAADRSVDPETDVVLIDGSAVGAGSAVRLRPKSGADAQDMFLAGRTARVAAVLRDVDGGTHLAITLDDLAEDGYNPHGRFLYFGADEVEPLRVDA
jgi:hypothetical protein